MDTIRALRQSIKRSCLPAPHAKHALYSAECNSVEVMLHLSDSQEKITKKGKSRAGVLQIVLQKIGNRETLHSLNRLIHCQTCCWSVGLDNIETAETGQVREKKINGTLTEKWNGVRKETKSTIKNDTVSVRVIWARGLRKHKNCTDTNQWM